MPSHAEATEKTRAALQKVVDAGIPGVIVCLRNKKGDILFHEAAGLREVGKEAQPMQKGDYNWIASCTKLITAIAVLQLVEQGKVKLDDSVEKILPELANLKILESSEGGNIKTKDSPRPPTLRELLTHTAGFTYSFFNQGTLDHFKAIGLANSFDTSRASISAPLARAPGESWEYGTNLDWAGQVVERLSGLSLNDYFQKNIFAPLGIKHISFLPESAGLLDDLATMHAMSPEGKVSVFKGGYRGHILPVEDKKIEVHYGGAGLYGNCAEYTRVLTVLLNQGKDPQTGTQLLKPETVDELYKHQLNEKQLKGLQTPIPAIQPELTNPCGAWFGTSSQWAIGGNWNEDWIPGRSKDHIWWAGLCNQFWIADRGHGLSGMIQSQVLPFGQPAVLGTFFMEIEPLWQEVVQA